MSRNAYRNLAQLKTTASTSRVLNLSLLAETKRNDPEHAAKPLFRSRTLNSSIILKHRLRSNEAQGLAIGRITATKVILPFDGHNLRLGGSSFFIGQTGQEALLREGAGVLPDDYARDAQTLALIDQLPSLDPFLMREHLRRSGINAGDCYFDISKADMQRMQEFVSGEIKQLVSMAFNMANAAGDPAGRLSEALLSTQIDERLEPLRVTLRLEGDSFREGVFCWKGFLYYKWMRNETRRDVDRVLSELGRITLMGPRDIGTMAHISGAQERVRRDLISEFRKVSDLLKAYDGVFEDLVSRSKASAFRDFLLNAPAMFLELGERVGNISHIASFWVFRFPNPARLAIPIEDALDMLQDFEASLGRDASQGGASSWSSPAA